MGWTGIAVSSSGFLRAAIFVRVGPLHFGTRDEAESQVRVVCRDNGYYREEARRGEMREEYREERR